MPLRRWQREIERDDVGRNQIMERLLTKSVIQAECGKAGHPNAVVHHTSNPDTHEAIDRYSCHDCGITWDVFPEED